MVKLNAAVLCCVLVSPFAGAAMDHGGADTASAFDRTEALHISRNAIGRTIDDYRLVNTDHTERNLADFRGKPLIISLIYTSCYHICPTTTQHLRKAIGQARAALGTDVFNVVTIGFDVFRDTPEMMQYFADQQRISEANWQFLSANEETIATLAEDLGFIYFPTANGFDHLIQTTLLDGSGRVHQQIYGMDFDAPIMVEPLKRLVLGKPAEGLIESISNQVKLFCTVYDPAQGKYRYDYSLFIGTFIGFLCVGLLGFQLIKEWRLTLGRTR